MSNLLESSSISAGVFSAATLEQDLLDCVVQHHGCCEVQFQQHQFTAIKSSHCDKDAAALYWFGGPISWGHLTSILTAFCLKEGIVKITLLKPHPDLPAGLALSCQEWQVPTQRILNELAKQLTSQLVYLPARPSLATPGLLVMDMDSTAIQIECIDEIAKLAGVGEQVAAVTARAMNGELDFAQSLQQRVAALQGAPVKVLSDVLEALPLMPGLTTLVQVLQQHRWRIAIASGGFTFFTDALQQRLSLDHTFANKLDILEGKLTGKVLGDIVDAQRKAAVVSELAVQYAIPVSQTIAIGDGANDLPMLAKAGLGVAFHAKPNVQAAAKAAITQGSLLQLLYLVAAT